VKQLNADSANFGDWCHLLFDQALLAEGGMLDDPASFVKRTNALLLSRAA
jgi:molecular chaperone HtpG